MTLSIDSFFPPSRLAAPNSLRSARPLRYPETAKSGLRSKRLPRTRRQRTSQTSFRNIRNETPPPVRFPPREYQRADGAFRPLRQSGTKRSQETAELQTTFSSAPRQLLTC